MHSHIDFEVSGQSLTIPGDQSVDFEEQNPMFNDIETMSYPIQVPFDYNRGVFKNLDDRDSSLRASDVEGKSARMKIGGLPFRTCVLHVQEDEVLKDRISINFDSRSKSFKDMIKDVKCREVSVDDDILIGEKVGQIDFNYQYEKYYYVFFGPYAIENSQSMAYRDRELFTDRESKSVSKVFTPPALGFSFPGACEGLSYIEPVQDKPKEYTNPDMIVKVPKVAKSYINTSLPYPQARYCNSRICYTHYDYDAEKEETSDSTVSAENAKFINEDYGPYWVLPADRPASGICFYVAYFLECLFKYLGVAYDMSALTDIEDFNYMAFFTTACKYDEVRMPSLNPPEMPDLPDMSKINSWLENRGCGGRLVPQTEEVETAITVKVADAPYRGTMMHFEVGKSPAEGWAEVHHIEQRIIKKHASASANINNMYANSENFPDVTVTEVIESLENTFGCRFAYDQEINKVTVYLLRDVFRSQKKPIRLNAQVNTVYKMTEKVTGVRMKYGAESDAQEQRDNVRSGKRDYDTDYDYIDYPENRTQMKAYMDTIQKIDATDMNCYVDPQTGNAHRIKVDKDATTIKEMKPVVFEVGQYKGVDIGDCSKEAEDNDTIVEITTSFQPITVNDVNFGNGGTTDPDYQPLLSPFIDEDMEHEFVKFRIANPFFVEDMEASLDYEMCLIESYDPSDTDDGQSPLMSHDWGLAVGILRTGDGGAGVENYDPDYDGFGNWRWRDIADNYCMSSDTMDQTGRWLGKTDQANTFSLKIRAWKPFLYYIDSQGSTHITADMSLEGQAVNPESPYRWLLPCADDERDQTGAITKRIRSRGLADTFMSEYIDFLLNRHKYRITALVEIAQLADITRHWCDRYEIAGRIGYIDRLKYSVDTKKGIGEVEIDFFSR